MSPNMSYDFGRSRFASSIARSAVVVCLFIGCGDDGDDAAEGPPAGQYAQQIVDLKNANVAVEVDANLKKGDRRFVGVMQYGLDIPGLRINRLVAENKYGVRVIDNTSDAIESNEHLQLQLGAKKYAETYNKLLQDKLGL